MSQIAASSFVCLGVSLAGPRRQVMCMRCFAVLNGDADGLVWADSPARPTCGIVQEAGFRSIYLVSAIATGDTPRSRAPTWCTPAKSWAFKRTGIAPSRTRLLSRLLASWATEQ
jgi:hypothetical protein